MDFSWIGTKLEKVIVDLSNNESVEIEFEYNEKGLRSKKIEKHKQNQTVLYTNNFSYYYDEEDRLITEIRNSDRYDYLYDETGIYGYVINLNARYYYIKDIIGQIIGIANESGTIIGRYDYDPFGNILMNTFASTNKILYKGYYYDDYIDLYYLKTRYYSPTWHRFISPDSIDYLDIYDLNGVNLFSYCNNNPVMYSDGDGNSATLIGWITKWLVDETLREINEFKQNLIVDSNEGSVRIVGSYRIFLPWVQKYCCDYLNNINVQTKDIIIGSNEGLQFEWIAHNAAFVFSFLTGDYESAISAASVDVGSTIFDDDHGALSYLMWALYVIEYPLQAAIDIVKRLIK
jgi:RHS repeat-associated protein